MIAAGCLLLGCAGTRSSFCQPDQLTSQPESLLVPCSPPRCLLPDDFAADGRTLQAQSGDVDRCHQADLRAYAVCAAHHQELADWVRARKASPKK